MSFFYSRLPSWLNSLRRSRPRFTREQHFELTRFLSIKVSDYESLIAALHPEDVSFVHQEQIRILKDCLNELDRARIPF